MKKHMKYLSYVLRRWMFGRSNEEIIAEFETMFPGRCLVCSMHHFGYGQGWEENPVPKPHFCIEGKST